MSRLDRRQFLERSMWLAAAAAAASMPGPNALAAVSGKKKGPNDVVRMGVIGVKGRGHNHVQDLAKMKDVNVVAICDIDENVIGESMKLAESSSKKKPKHYVDARKMLEDKSLDAVSIATCNHTHTFMTLNALAAGKHVYVEKPLSHNLREGAAIVAAQQYTGLVVQHGTQSRSSPGLHEMVAYLKSGTLGPLNAVRGFCYKRRTSIGTQPVSEIPKGVNYDLWLGPAPERAFTRNRFHYNWHWHWDYGNGDIGNQGVHEMDRARWGLGINDHPKTITSIGGRLGYTDDGETPNTMITHFDYGKDTVPFIFEVRGLETDAYRGCKIGVIYDLQNGYVVNPSYEAATAFDKDGKQLKTFGGWGDHFRNFIDAVKAGKPEAVAASPVDGHLSASLCHLANVSYRLGTPASLSDAKSPFTNPVADDAWTRVRDHLKAQGVDLAKEKYLRGRTIQLDGAAERIPNDPAADLLLTREYRKPFTLPTFG